MSSPDGVGWSDLLAELDRRVQENLALGGPAAVAKQHARGKLTARERLELLFGADWNEIGKITAKTHYSANGEVLSSVPVNTIIGWGAVGDKRVAAAADDYTVGSGTSDGNLADKWIFIERWALELGRPLVRLVETAGGSVRLTKEKGITHPAGYAPWPAVELLAEVPVVGVALGPCAGLGAVKIVSTHFSVMVAGQSQVFAAGPRLVQPASGAIVSKEDLGGAKIHARATGVVDNEAIDERDAIRQVRAFLDYMPSNVRELPPTIDPAAPEFDPQDLTSFVPSNPRKPIDMRRVLRSVVDRDSLFEIGSGWGKSSITALARVCGRPVAIIANDSFQFAGALTAAAAEKCTRFIDMCDTFHIPMMNFVDQPGVNVGASAEAEGTIRCAVRMRQAIAQSRIPWMSIFVRRAYGVAGGAYGPLGRAEIRYAWPTARWGSLPLEGGIEAAHRSELENSERPDELLASLRQEYSAVQSPFRTVERFLVEEMIAPAETRRVAEVFVEDAYVRLRHNLGIRTRTMRS